MRGDQVVVHVARMAGRVAQPVDAGDFGEPEEQPAEAPVAPVRSFAMPGVDVLAEQRDLAHAARPRAALASATIASTGRETSAPRV